MPKTNAEKQENIIKAAGIVFSQKGFHQARMDEIAEAAGVAKGTLYYNYSSKSKLFAATVTCGLNRIMAAIEAELASDLPFLDHLRAIVATIIRLYISNKEVTRIYANEMSSGIEDEVRSEIKAVREQFTAFVEAQLQTGQEKGYLAPLPSHLSAVAVIGIIDALCSHHLEHPDLHSPDELTDTVFTILSSGLARNRQAGE
ncbi:MAG TPA: hypothetical protein DHV36_12730 [Desulfobacteraceae bacterium]|nr:hypothetical protein [Desulfobacteraceae bacterium]